MVPAIAEDEISFRVEYHSPRRMKASFGKRSITVAFLTGFDQRANRPVRADHANAILLVTADIEVSFAIASDTRGRVESGLTDRPVDGSFLSAAGKRADVAIGRNPADAMVCTVGHVEIAPGV